MKVLLDECVVQEFRHFFVGLQNGALLATAAADGFDALITTDRGFQHQHNLAALPLAVVILLARSNDLQDLRPLVSDLLQALATLPPTLLTLVGPVP
jgi:hypothetical protein